ncbi:MAG: hypothetical protein ACRD13_15080, partial [Terriglobales bacterium]
MAATPEILPSAALAPAPAAPAAAPAEPRTPQVTPEAAPVPRHVAIIMDGNGRWAAARGLP